MSLFRRIEIVEPEPSLFVRETSIFPPKTFTFPYCTFPSFSVQDKLDLAFDLLNPTPIPELINFTSPFPHFDSVTDLIQVDKTPFYTSTRRIQHRVNRFRTESYLQSLCDRVSVLERSFDRLVNVSGGDRKYTWTAKIKGAEDRKYEWTAEIKRGKKEKEKATPVKNLKWTAEIKDKDDEECPITRSYTFKASTGDESDSSGSEKKEKQKDKKKKKKGEKQKIRAVEIEGPSDHGAVVIRQAFAKRVEKARGKRKELSPQDAAIMIQMSFRAYLIRRSQALRALRELAVAKAKLKEIRSLFNNFSYRRRVAHDGVERQRFSEKIIVLLLTVDGIEGADLMVRAAKRSMVDELEAMLDVVDPQPPGKSGSMKRRTFDMPDGVLQKELAAGVAEVVQMVNENATFEACL
ncbi:hypothetical protein NMG60_11012243 [Bertholletia excelsa]